MCEDILASIIRGDKSEALILEEFLGGWQQQPYLWSVANATISLKIAAHFGHRSIYCRKFCKNSNTQFTRSNL